MSAIGSERLKMARRRLSTLVCATARDIATDEIAPARKFRRFMGFVRQAEESLAEYRRFPVNAAYTVFGVLGKDRITYTFGKAVLRSQCQRK
jgi:hypothetical protein